MTDFKNKITVLCQINSDNSIADTSYELITKANDLISDIKKLNNEDYIVEAVAVNDEIDKSFIEKAYMAGAYNFVLVKQKCNNAFDIANAFYDYFINNPSKMILFSATFLGRAIAPRVCAKLNTGLVADCTGLEIVIKNNEAKLAPTRPTFGSELMATILSKKEPECATIRPKVFKADFTRKPAETNYSEYKIKDFSSVILDIIQSKEINDIVNIKDELSKAQIVLTAGYGLYDGTDKYFKKLKEIAKKYNVNYAVTRKVVDFGFEKADYQIGQTGITINPKLYISFGVSGALQHVMGMKNSKKIVAINTDKDADIFKYADYKIVYDAKKIIDEI